VFNITWQTPLFTWHSWINVFSVQIHTKRENLSKVDGQFISPTTVKSCDLFLMQCLVENGKWQRMLWRMPSSEMVRRVVHVRSDVSEERIASIFKVTRIGKLGTSLAVTSKPNPAARWFLLPWWWRLYVPPKYLLLQEPHGIMSQKTAFFKVIAVKTSNLT
jgi:hypothetical protein